MDKALSIGSAIVIALAMLAVVWFVSGGDDLFHPRARSLEGGLARLGGPLGFWGGLGMVLAVGGAVYGLHELCNLWAGRAYVTHLKSQGLDRTAIAARVDALPVSGGLRRRMMKSA